MYSASLSRLLSSHIEESMVRFFSPSYWRKRIQEIVYVHNYKSNCLTVQSSLLFELDREDTGEFDEQMNVKLVDELESSLSLYTVLAISWFFHK